MLEAEKYRVLLFVGAIASVYIFAFGGLIRGLLEHFQVIKSKPGKLQLIFRKVFYSLAIIGVFCFLYAYFIEPYWLSVRRTEIVSEKIKTPLKIVHISDIHSDPKPRLEEKLPAVIAEEKPDLVVFSGDSINSPAGLPVFRKCISEIAKIAPVYVVHGNWDSWFWARENLFAETGVKVLNTNNETIEIKGNKLTLSGLSVGRETRLKETLEAIDKESFSIFLFHYPDLIEEVSQSEIDLYCAGHTHGGQIALPFYGALVTLSKFDKKYESGTFQVGKTWLNVSRGIGMEGGHAPRVRFWSRPEVTVIDVLPKL